MTSYITLIMYICIFSIILELILPDNKLKKYIGVLISLAIIMALASPLIDFLSEDKITETLSKGIETIKLNTSYNSNEYNISDYKDKVMFRSVKDKLENEILNSCKIKFNNKYEINKINIYLNDNYQVESVKVYVKDVDNVISAHEIINFLQDEFEINDFLIEIIEEDS